MADLCSGISYGLSQSGANNDNNAKELIFLKLTDSAVRAIEEYHKNQKKLGTHSTIQFLGNSGTISFPSLSNNGGVNFQFSITETEGLMQGSFECIQQAQNQLEVLGALPNKMRIHAKEDVYETTRHRMAVAEENQKNKCTREIKGPTKKGIVRTVKLPPSTSRISNIPNNISTLNKQRDSSSSSSASSLSAASAAAASTNTSSSNNNHHKTNNSHSSSNSLNNIPSNSYNSLSANTTTTTTSSSSSSLSVTATSAKAASPSVKNGGFSSSSSSANNNNNHSSSLSNGIGSAANGTTNGYSGAGTPPTYNQHNGNNNHHHNNGISDRHHTIQSSSVNNSSSNNHSSMPTATNHSQYNYNNTNSPNMGGGAVPSRGSASSNGSSSINKDIMKRPIKERLIHMLALKQYKKPELYARLRNEGIRDRDNKLVGNLLKSISVMRDNVYILNRYIWNDVQEDWAFYSEQDRRSLKLRKPQNLTPPVSSDGGSSTSGQSPTSTHNGSPPPPVKRPSMNGEKYSEGPNAKKTRISHCQQKDSIRTDNYANDYVKAQKNRRSLIDSRESVVKSRSRDSHQKHHQGGGDVDSPMSTHGYYSSSSVTPTSNAAESSAEENTPRINFKVLSPEVANRISEPTVTLGMHQPPTHQLQQSQTSTQFNGRDLESSPHGHMAMDAQALTAAMSNAPDNEKHDFSAYTRIVTIEQRRRYKTEFDSDYSDYRKLYAETERVSQHFSQLGETLRQYNPNDPQYKVIQKKIFQEYQKSMVDSQHQEKKKRFQYLHHKLSHIKKLVNDFDTSITNGKLAIVQNNVVQNY